jgi:hypothetical protein
MRMADCKIHLEVEPRTLAWGRGGFNSYYNVNNITSYGQQRKKKFVHADNILLRHSAVLHGLVISGVLQIIMKLKFQVSLKHCL